MLSQTLTSMSSFCLSTFAIEICPPAMINVENLRKHSPRSNKDISHFLEGQPLSHHRHNLSNKQPSTIECKMSFMLQQFMASAPLTHVCSYLLKFQFSKLNKHSGLAQTEAWPAEAITIRLQKRFQMSCVPVSTGVDAIKSRLANCSLISTLLAYKFSPAPLSLCLQMNKEFLEWTLCTSARSTINNSPLSDTAFTIHHSDGKLTFSPNVC